MREARLILPKQDNHGQCLAHMLDPVLDDVARRFGGATVTDAFGVWTCPAGRLYRDPSWCIDIACPDTPDSVDNLRDIAGAIAEWAEQEAVYLRLPSGTVEFVERARVGLPLAA